jgi:autotransporter-associated beta strand protein
LIPTNVLNAQLAGFLGTGVKVGVMDSGVDPDDPTLNASDATGRNKVAWFKSYVPGVSDPSAVNDNFGHGTTASQLVAGDPYSDSAAGVLFKGGVAPGSSLYEAQICYGYGTSSGEACHPGAPAYSDLVAQGVKVINESFGGTKDVTQKEGGASNSTAKATYNLLKPVKDAGILQVFATGDDSTMQNPGIYAGLPYLFPDMQPFIIAVTGIDIDANGNPSGLYTENGGPTPCGVAAAWCLSAPAQVYTVPVDPAFTTGYSVGTSAATAIVTGVTAQVWEAFPWMSAANVSDTVLTTATQIPGCPKEQCGWGMVDAERAVHGPARFAFGEFKANIPSGTTSTFANDIGDSGSLTLTGPGTLVVTGTNTWTGGTAINDGTLEVDGSIASDVNIAAGGMLAGIGTVDANVVNAGTVTSEGTAAAQGLTITGNLTDMSGSTTAVALGDPLKVGGTANLDGTMEVLAAPSDYTVHSTETLLNAGTVSGTFQNLTFASGVFYTGTLNYTSTQVKVALTPAVEAATVFASPLATVQTIRSAGNVQSAIDVSNQWIMDGQTAGHEAWIRDAGKFLAAPTTANAVVSLNSLSGEIYATSRALEVEQSLATDTAMANREHAQATHGQSGVWVQSLGPGGGFDGGGYDPATYRAGGSLMGVGGNIVGNLSAGLVAGRSRVWSQMAGLGGRLDARENVTGAYARWGAGVGFYLAGRVSYTSIRSQVQRELLLGETLTGLSGQRNDRVTVTTLEGGRTWNLGAATLAPYVSVAGLHLQQDAFTEQGSAMGLAAPSQSNDVLFGTVGVRYGQRFAWAGGHSSLEGYAGYRHLFSGSDLSMSASFAGVPEAVFAAAGQDLSRNVGIVGAHWATAVTDRWGWFLDADYRTGGGNTDPLEAHTGITVAF